MSKIYNELYERAERMVRQFDVACDDFDDTVQLVMMNIFERGFALKPISAKLLYVITRNTLIDRYRREARFLRYLDRNLYFDSAGTVCDSRASGLERYTPVEDEQCRENELDTIIDCESLKPLSAPLHAVLELRLREMIYTEIAKQLQISVGTVRSRLHHARRCNRANRQ